jgi:hypothetical protein
MEDEILGLGFKIVIFANNKSNIENRYAFNRYKGNSDGKINIYI